MWPEGNFITFKPNSQATFIQANICPFDLIRAVGNFLSDKSYMLTIEQSCNAICMLLTVCEMSGGGYGTLQWRNNVLASVSNHQPHGCLLKRLFKRRSKKTSKLRVIGLCARNSPVTQKHRTMTCISFLGQKCSENDDILHTVCKHL